jgi:hypothetical protein
MKDGVASMTAKRSGYSKGILKVITDLAFCNHLFIHSETLVSKVTKSNLTFLVVNERDTKPQGKTCEKSIGDNGGMAVSLFSHKWY